MEPPAATLGGAGSAGAGPARGPGGGRVTHLSVQLLQGRDDELLEVRGVEADAAVRELPARQRPGAPSPAPPLPPMPMPMPEPPPPLQRDPQVVVLGRILQNKPLKRSPGRRWRLPRATFRHPAAPRPARGQYPARDRNRKLLASQPTSELLCAANGRVARRLRPLRRPAHGKGGALQEGMPTASARGPAAPP